MDSGKPPAQSVPLWLLQTPLFYQSLQQTTLAAPCSKPNLHVLYTQCILGQQSASYLVNNTDNKSIKDENYNDVKCSKRMKIHGQEAVFSVVSSSVKQEATLSSDGLTSILRGLKSSTKCPTCDKWFRSRQQLSQHMVVHTDVRKYMCTYCSRTFKQPSHLHQHHRIHTGEKPYKCPLKGCTRAFPQQSNLNHHLRNHDRPAPPSENTCIFCNRIYASEAVLHNHLLKIHLCDPEFLPFPKMSSVHPSPSGFQNISLRSTESTQHNLGQKPNDENLSVKTNASFDIFLPDLKHKNEDILSSINKRTTTKNNDDKYLFTDNNQAKHEEFEHSLFLGTNINPNRLQSDRNCDHWTSFSNDEDSNHESYHGIQTLATVFQEKGLKMQAYRDNSKLMSGNDNNTKVNISGLKQIINETDVKPEQMSSEQTNKRNGTIRVLAPDNCFGNSKANLSEIHSEQKVHVKNNTSTKYISTWNMDNNNTNNFVRDSKDSFIPVDQTVFSAVAGTVTSKASKRKAFRPQRIVRGQLVFLND